jgi:ParB family chromosome partitioning protein
LGKSQSYIANKLRLLGLSDEIQEKIRSAGLSERHARSLLRLRDNGARAAALSRIINGKMTVKESEAVVDELFDEQLPLAPTHARDGERIEKFEAALNEAIKTLSSLGIKAAISKSFYARRTYITVMIERE